MSFDGAAFGAEVVSMVKDYVARETATLRERIQVLEAREAKAGAPGVGVSGVAINPDTGMLVLRLTDGSTHEAGRVVGADGKDGADGRDGRDGKDGRDGVDGANGLKGETGRGGADGRDGADGKDGAPGENGRDGEPGRHGSNGRDGVGLAGMLIDRQGGLVATLSDGTMRALGAVVGRDGERGVDGKDGQAGAHGRDGRDGADGLGFDDMDEQLDDDGRTVIRTYRRGDVVKEFRFCLPALLDRGVYKDGHEYAAGDGVTWAGSFWIAQRQTSAKPDDADGSWRLAVKRGRNGKDGEMKPVRTPSVVKVG